MNNLKYYEDSLAYDYSMFVPAEKKSTPKKGRIIDIPETTKAKARRRRRAAFGVSSKVTAILVTVFVIGMLAGNIYLRSQITETEYSISKLESEISLADSKLADVNFQMEQKLSYNNLEQAAKELGMKKMDKTQIVYLRTNEEDKVVLGEPEQTAENNQ